MANTLTVLTALPIKCLGRGRTERVKLVIGDTGTDADLFAANAAKMIGLVGGSSSKQGSDTTLTFKDGTTTVGTIFIASGTALSKDQKNQLLAGIAATKGNALVVQSDVAITLYMNAVYGPDLACGVPN